MINEEWRESALCAQVGLDMFFPEQGGDIGNAKRVCAMCPVSLECLQFAIVNKIRHGVWGGTSEKQRFRMRGVSG